MDRNELARTLSSRIGGRDGEAWDRMDEAERDQWREVADLFSQDDPLSVFRLADLISRSGTTPSLRRSR
jgi:hypothetical protein